LKSEYTDLAELERKIATRERSSGWSCGKEDRSYELGCVSIFDPVSLTVETVKGWNFSH
jgi:hypothetical protein